LKMIKNMFKEKTILVTGGTGTVGRAIVELLLECAPRVVRVFSRDETKQYDLHKEKWGEKRLRFFIGDVRDKDRLLHAMDNVDFVFHTAAMKHVMACEYNPFEAMFTNIGGARNVIEAAMESGVGKVMLTSTDKATNPCNTMGVSKLFAERLFTSANYYKGTSRTIFATVRFGNIMGSRGSVLPVFRRQIESGGPVTLTDPEMTRFVMTKTESINFVFKATQLAKGGEIFISKMPVVKMNDLVEVMIEMYAAPGMKKKIKVEMIGPQPGEKIYEELMTEEEVTRAVETEDMYILKPQIQDLFVRDHTYPGQRAPHVGKYTSKDEKTISKAELAKLLKRIEKGE